ncbi:DUF427 domain-containing protein [Actinoallomurus sp. NPDC050550]|uniref:DUF427 domain-containing protein n=1 Tax=Actinoallomurus sp. NPDC050550 TaxID=3154937 RepID=UPI0033CE7408
MSLTLPGAPLSGRPAGVFNGDVAAPRHLLYFEPTPKRVRVEFGGETIADSTGAHLLFETGLLPVYYFPVADVRMDLLKPTDHTTHCPVKGQASYWTISAGGRTAENAVWGYPDPIAPWLEGFVAFYWDAMDAWYEEDEQVVAHPHDPYSRIDVLRSTRRVRVSVDGTVLAESERPTVLFETGLPVRYYLPREDVRLDLLKSSGTETWCAYKGRAGYWSYGGEDVAWTYEEPLHDAERVRDLVCFFNEKVDLEIDGEPQERPRSRWS